MSKRDARAIEMQRFNDGKELYGPGQDTTMFLVQSEASNVEGEWYHKDHILWNFLRVPRCRYILASYMEESYLCYGSILTV